MNSSANALIVNTVSALADELLTRAADSDRCIVALAGAPGSGKSTTCEKLQSELEKRLSHPVPIAPMDGFHLDNAVLHERGLFARKGAPQTFDVDGLSTMLSRLSATPAVEVLVPVFDREYDLSRAGARVIDATPRIILVEGNYLLLNELPWSALRQYFDVTVMLQCDAAELHDRLMNRWRDLDYPEAEAREKVEQNDMPNAETVISQSAAADICLDSGTVAVKPKA